MNKLGPIEAALSTDLRGEPYNFSLWDIHTGTQLVAFKGNKSSPLPKCLQLIDNNYFITVCDNVVQVWSIFNKKSQDQKLFLPSRPSTICMSPCGNYLVAGISEMIFVWQLRSGNLLAHCQRHYQNISVLKTTRCGSFLVSGGEDGLVLVWPFADLISQTHHTGALNVRADRKDVGVNEPRFTWQHHSGQITDVHLTNGGLCLTTSIDMVVNMYDYSSGRRLLSVNLGKPIWSITMNKNETSIYAGSVEGDIYEIPVSSISISILNSGENTEEGVQKPTFVGHKGKVNFLELSTDGTRLISASLDATCKIWDVRQRKMLQSVKHQASISNLVTLLVPESLALTSLSQAQLKPPISIKPLKRNLYKAPRDVTVMDDDLFEEASNAIVHAKNRSDLWNIHQDYREQSDKVVNISNQPSSIPTTNLLQNGDENELNQMKAKFRALYKLSAEKIFKDSADHYLKGFKE